MSKFVVHGARFKLFFVRMILLGDKVLVGSGVSKGSTEVLHGVDEELLVSHDKEKSFSFGRAGTCPYFLGPATTSKKMCYFFCIPHYSFKLS